MENGGCLVVDELYEGLVYVSSVKTALSLADDIIVVNGFSKTYATMGLRLGWMVVPEGLVRPIQTIAQSVFISPPTISQYAGALLPSWYNCTHARPSHHL